MGKKQVNIVLVFFLWLFPLIAFVQVVQGEGSRSVEQPLRLQIKETPLGKVRIEGNQYYSTSFLNRYFSPILGDKFLRQETLERTLRLINEFPDIYVNALLIPKKELISTDLLLQVSDDRPVHLVLEANNFGSRFTGKTQVTSTLTWGDLTGHGDSVLLRTLYATPAVLDFPMWQIGYTVPMGSSGAKVNFLYLKSQFVVGADFIPINIEGKTQLYGVNMSYPLIRESRLSSDFLLGMRAATVHSFEGDQEKFQNETRAIFFGTNWKVRTSDWNTVVIEGTLTQGLGHTLGGTEGNDATKLNLNLVDKIFVGSRFSFLLRTSGQVSNKRMSVSDQFSIGGADSVRGFTPGESFGDNGAVFSAEAQLAIDQQERVLFVVFLDNGRTFLRDAKVGLLSQKSLTGAGAGFRARWNESLSGRLDFGIPLSPNENVDKEKSVVTGSVVVRF